MFKDKSIYPVFPDIDRALGIIAPYRNMITYGKHFS